MRHIHFSCDQAALRTLLSVRLHVRLSVRPSPTLSKYSYHLIMPKIYYHWQKGCPCKRSRSEVIGQGHKGQNKKIADFDPNWAFSDFNSSLNSPMAMKSIYLRVYSLHHNVLPTLQSIPLMTNGPLYPITQDSSCHGQHTMPRNPWSFPWPVPHSWVCMNVCVCCSGGKRA